MDDTLDSDQQDSRRFSVQLLVIHPTMPIADITSELGLEPKIAHEVGTPRRSRKVVYLLKKCPDTRWRYSKRYEVHGQHFADKIDCLVEKLSPHKAFFDKLRKTGGSASLIIKFLGDDGYFGDEIRAATLSKMSDLQLDLGIEVYTVPQA